MIILTALHAGRVSKWGSIPARGCSAGTVAMIKARSACRCAGALPRGCRRQPSLGTCLHRTIAAGSSLLVGEQDLLSCDYTGSAAITTSTPAR